MVKLGVSIPKRVSEALNHNCNKLFLGNLLVSIPKRVSEALNRLDQENQIIKSSLRFNP